MADFGMALHQSASFHPLLLRIPEAEAVFWPGCALMNLEGRILEKTMDVLRRAEPEIRLAAGCCGQPTVYLMPHKKEGRTEALADLLARRGVKRIYTACPNCTLQLRKLRGVAVIPIWPVLAAHLTEADLEKPVGRYIWHDPCPTRTDPAQQAAARQLLGLARCDFTEPEHTGAHTICCGNLHMMAYSDPASSAKMRARRLAELPEERTILSSCEGCLNAFRAEGRQTCHLLELLFGQSRTRGWGNRIKTTMKAPIK